MSSYNWVFLWHKTECQYLEILAFIVTNCTFSEINYLKTQIDTHTECLAEEISPADEEKSASPVWQALVLLATVAPRHVTIIMHRPEPWPAEPA